MYQGAWQPYNSQNIVLVFDQSLTGLKTVIKVAILVKNELETSSKNSLEIQQKLTFLGETQIGPSGKFSLNYVEPLSLMLQTQLRGNKKSCNKSLENSHHERLDFSRFIEKAKLTKLVEPVLITA